MKSNNSKSSPIKTLVVTLTVGVSAVILIVIIGVIFYASKATKGVSGVVQKASDHAQNVQATKDDINSKYEKLTLPKELSLYSSNSSGDGFDSTAEWVYRYKSTKDQAATFDIVKSNFEAQGFTTTNYVWTTNHTLINQTLNLRIEAGFSDNSALYLIVSR